MGDTYNETTDQDATCVRNHGDQSHFRLSDTSVPLGGSTGDPITERTSCEQRDRGAAEDGEVGVAYVGGSKVPRRSGQGLGLGDVDDEEARGDPGEDEGRPLDDGEHEDLEGQ